jgi:chloramphenicol-sensitive protein RarD
VELLRTLTDRKLMLGLAASGFCVSINWGGYIWAIQAGHALDSSLAYYILPLVNLGLGVLILREKLSLRQGLSIIGVVLAVVLLTIDRGQLPWIVLLLPASFGLYGLLRKMVAVDAMIGVTVETLLVAPLAIVYLVMQPDGGALTQDSWTIKTLLVLCGPMTTIPLILFTYGARRMKLSSLGLLQYINPTIQMFVAAFVLGEPIHRLQMFAFLLIWGGLVVYSWPSRTTPQPAG